MKMTVNYPPSSVGVADAHSFHNIQLELALEKHESNIPTSSVILTLIAGMLNVRGTFYLVVFLKFIASIVPTIEVDSTTAF